MRKRLPSLLMTLYLGLFSFIVNAQTGTLDSTFNKEDVGFGGANEMIHSLVLQTDGKVVIGGEFTSFNGVARNHIARLNADGSLDASFEPGTGTNRSIYVVALQSDGKVLVGGSFTSYNGTSRNSIARLNADGTLDGSFNCNVNDAIYSLAVQGDGKIVIGGIFTSINGVARNHIARLNADGTLDATFITGGGTDNAVYTLAIQSDGKVLLGGGFATYNGVARNGIARLNTNGSIDVGFNPGSGATGGIVNSLAIQKDGKVLIGGYFTTYNGIARNYIARLNTNGSLDTSFNPGSGASGGGVFSIITQSDDKIMIGGYFSSYNGAPRKGIARLNPDGSLDLSYFPGGGFNDGVFALGVQADSKVIVAGGFTSYSGIGKNRIARVYGVGPTLIVGPLASDTLCIGTRVTIPYTVMGTLTTGNRFTAQLSDANGRFTKPVRIGAIYGTSSGSISVTIPSTTVPGTGYRIRLLSDKPAMASFDNGVDLVLSLVPPAPTVTANGPITFCVGRNVTLTSSASTNNQWYRNGVLISGATEQTYTVTTTGKYTVRTRETGCLSPASTAIVVTVNKTPTAKITYSGQPFCPIGKATPTITGAKGGVFSSSTLAINTTTGVVDLAAPAGAYTVNYIITATEGCDAVTAATSVIIRQPVAITTQPEHKSICTGATAKLSVVASGAGLSYQWRKNDIDISGASSNTYTIANASLTDAGAYSVQVKDACGEVVSNPAALMVTQATTISTQPVAKAVCVGAAASFTVTASGSNVKYQWRKARIDIPGATSNTYVIAKVTATDAGSYDVVVTGDCGIQTSTAAALTVNIPVDITTQPTDKTVCAGTSTTFSVTAVGTGLTYQWRKGGKNITGATSRTYTIAAPTTADADQYDVIVSNTCKTVTSEVATLTINPTPAIPVITATSNVLTSSATTGNRWYYNGVAITGATAQTCLPIASGLYTVQVTLGSCKAVSAPFNFVFTRIDGPSAWNGEVSLYPNPVASTLMVKNPAARKLNLQFYDVNGKKVYETMQQASLGKIDLQGLAGGIYQVVITDTKRNESVLQTIVKL